MDLQIHRVGTLVEIFSNDAAAHAAVRELRAVGFAESQIEVVSPEGPPAEDDVGDERVEIEESATAGAVTGLGLGAIWGLGILTGIAPDMGPMIASGSLGILLTSAAAGAATVGTAGALIGLGVSQEDLEEHEKRNKARHTIVTVRAGIRADIAASVLDRFNRPQHVPRQAM